MASTCPATTRCAPQAAPTNRANDASAQHKLPSHLCLKYPRDARLYLSRVLLADSSDVRQGKLREVGSSLV